MNITPYFQYDPTSPSGLVWNINSHQHASGKGTAERKPLTAAGSEANGVWQVQVMEGDCRHRTTAHRVIWELHYGSIPEDSVILHRHGRSNTIENLICVTRQEHNWIKARRSGKTNVTLLPSGRYFTTIRGYKSLGTYDTYEEAAQTYLTELNRLIGHLL